MLKLGVLAVVTFFQLTIAQYIPRSVTTKDISNDCAVQMEAYVQGLQNGQAWAWNLFDASPKLPYGILTGSSTDPGNYDECLRIEYNSDETGRILGKYCSYAFILFLPVNITMDEDVQSIKKTWIANSEMLSKSASLPMQPEDRLRTASLSACIPDACTPSEVIESLGLNDLPLLAMAGSCETADDIQQFTGSDLAFIIFLGIILLVVIASTAYDEISQRKKITANPLFISFSITTNMKQIMKDSSSTDRIACLDGLRVFSMLWVIMGHRYGTVSAIPFVNKDYLDEWATKVYSQYAQGATVAVDTFLFLTGFLMAMSMIKSQSKPNAKFNIIIYYIHRYLRLTPALAVIYFLHVSLYDNLSSGPYWRMLLGAVTGSCSREWPSFFFYYQNYLHPNNMCLLHTWYLSMDMQIFILSPLLLLPLAKFRNIMVKFGVPAVLLISMICPFVITYVYETQIGQTDYNVYYYYPTHTRISAWVVGVYIGAIVYTFKDTKLKISTLLNLAIWCTVICGMLACILVGNEVKDNYNRLGTSFYLSLYKPAWCVGLSWIIFACMKGYGGIFNYVLTANIFQKLSKITYSMYLVHLSCMLYSVASTRYPAHFSDFNLFHLFLGDVFVTTAVGLVWCLLFESPLIVIEKIVFGRNTKPSVKKQEDKIDVPEIKTVR